MDTYRSNDLIGQNFKPAGISVRFIVAIGFVLLSLVVVSTTRADEPNGLQAAEAIEQALTQAIAKAEKSVVAIARVKRDREELAMPRFEPIPRFGQVTVVQPEPEPNSPDFVPNEFATGVVIDARGLFLTNAHTIGNNEQHRHFITTSERKVFEVRVKGADSKSDLAVLELIGGDEGQTLGGPARFTPITFGDAKTLKKGQIVITLGNPYGIARDGQCSASWGIVSNLSRKLTRKPTEDNPQQASLHQYGTLIQTDAKLNFGTSGGALLNIRGEMVGLTTSLAARSGFEQAAGFAIPIDDAFRRVIDTLKEGREVAYGFLGIQPESLGAREIINGRSGIRVHSVSPGTPAIRAGLRPTDIVTHVNEEPVFEADGLRLAIGKLSPGSAARLAVINEQGRKDLLTAYVSKTHNNGPKIVTKSEPEWRGLRVDYATAYLPTPTSPKANDTAIVAADIVPNSPAAKAGLSRLSIITRVGDQDVNSPAAFWQAVKGLNGPVDVLVFTDHPQVVTVAAE
jgi:S1-C subfamily serine protease